MSLRFSGAVSVGGFRLRAELDAPAGEVVAVLGPNGSGKSTLLRTVAGLIGLDKGCIELDGRVLDEPDAGTFVDAEQRPIGVVFQDYLLFDHLSALDNVGFGLRARGVARADARQRAAGWLERVGLAAERDLRPRSLSGGQAQRVALARALAIEPRLLLLDEPLAALDAGTRRQVRRELRRQLDGFDGIRLLVTHDPVDAYALADRLVIVDRGEVVQRGSIGEITARPRSAYVAELVGTNLLVGEVDADGLTTDDGALVAVVAEFSGTGFATIRPSSITLSTDEPHSSARNVFTGVIDDITRLDDRARIGIAGRLPLVAEVTTAALDTLGLRPGDRVHAAVKATDIETYPR